MRSLDLGSVVDYTRVVDLRRLFLELLNEPTPILLNCEEIERIDGAGLQLILCFWLSAGKREVPVILDKPSWAFLEAARTVGLEKVLELP